MTINASEIPSVVNISNTQIVAKKILRHWLRDNAPALTSALDAIGDDPIICAKNPNLNHQVQHVDLGKPHADFGQAVALVSQAYSILCSTHNNLTAQGIAAGINMDAPNGPGGR